MKPKSNYINREQFNDILDYIPELGIRKWADEDVRMSMKIAYYCALRYGSEVAKLTKGSFDFQRHEVYLGRTKTRKEDYGVIPKFFEPELNEYLMKKNDTDFILSPPPTRKTMYDWLMRTGAELGIEAFLTPQKITGEKTKMHIFRKSFLKDMHNGTFGKKATLGAIQSHARHKDLLQTVRYLRLDIEGAKEYFDDDAISDELTEN